SNGLTNWFIFFTLDKSTMLHQHKVTRWTSNSMESHSQKSGKLITHTNPETYEDFGTFRQRISLK
ncbi:MAG TPA: hypothetical protein VKK79_23355, partial [Candidatus Lokiarchaeia archaeon]|nr:hypothetical protein [Candidatus Lokiarchaeia archaeon]